MLKAAQRPESFSIRDGITIRQGNLQRTDISFSLTNHSATLIGYLLCAITKLLRPILRDQPPLNGHGRKSTFLTKLALQTLRRVEENTRRIC